MKINLYNLKAELIGQQELSEHIFLAEINQTLISQSVRVFLSNQRKAHAKAKTRSEVAGTTKKIWAQKGTGRARHGDSRAPIFVGGGSAHGPQGDQNFKLKINKKMAKIATRSVLSMFAKNKSIIAIDKLDTIKPKTKQAKVLLANLAVTNDLLKKSRKTAIIINPTEKNPKRCFNNLSSAHILSSNSLNPYLLLKHDFLIFSKDSLDFINKTK